MFTRKAQIYEQPKLPGELELECGRCGRKGSYRVGTICVTESDLRGDDAKISEKIGFSGCFRCRACGSHDSWRFPAETMARLCGMLMQGWLGRKKDTPIIHGILHTFDGHAYRYGAQAEEHLKELIAQRPNDAVVWDRLGNFYRNAGMDEQAMDAFTRAVQLDRGRVESHFSLGCMLFEQGNRARAARHLHAVLIHARKAVMLQPELRRDMVREALEDLLEISEDSHGRIPFLPDAKTMRELGDEDLAAVTEESVGPPTMEIRKFDLGSRRGWNRLVDMFLDDPDEGPDREEVSVTGQAPEDGPEGSRRDLPVSVGRNQPCPCGSGRKYKKCCGARKE